MIASLFAPFATLAERLLPHAVDDESDRAHDVSHILRVWKAVLAIQAQEGGNLEVLVAATILHDCVAVEKTSPQRARASRFAAEKASALLTKLDWPSGRVNSVAHAVEAHSFAAQVTPVTLEADILQDADRLDALGMIGVARCFYIAGRLGTALYDPVDPHGDSRTYDDKHYAIDHFQTKLLRLSKNFRTNTGAQLAAMRDSRMIQFLDLFYDEI